MKVTQNVIRALNLKGSYDSYNEVLYALQNNQLDIDFNFKNEDHDDILDLINEWQLGSEYTKSMGDELAQFAVLAIQEQTKAKGV